MQPLKAEGGPGLSTVIALITIIDKDVVHNNIVIMCLICRGVILYAMVCGRLPFGDDNQIRKMTTRDLHFSRAISHGQLLAVRNTYMCACMC